MISGTATSSPVSHGEIQKQRDAKIWQVAKDFESVFLAEMLSKAGVAEARSSFGGGAGEDAFAGLLVREQATLIVERGGLGLAEQVYAALVSRGAGK